MHFIGEFVDSDPMRQADFSISIGGLRFLAGIFYFDSEFRVGEGNPISWFSLGNPRKNRFRFSVE
jgi:hypothetical protein